MLEDDADRLRRFSTVLERLAPDLDLLVWRDAHRMMREAGPLLPKTVMISLDHDLESEPGSPDPGDGYMVAMWLVSQPIIRPVIIHTSNGGRATWMEGAFDLEGWPYFRVPPLGDDWVETVWRRTVRRLLKKRTIGPK